MLEKLSIGFGLMAVCVAIHATGIVTIFRWLQAHIPSRALELVPSAWRLIRIASWMVLLHLVEIVVWAAYYTLSGAMPDLQTAAYFSAVTYTTTGYGDLVLAEEWRLVGGIEALTGILMCGLSTGMFFAVFSVLFGRDREGAPPAS